MLIEWWLARSLAGWLAGWLLEWEGGKGRVGNWEAKGEGRRADRTSTQFACILHSALCRLHSEDCILAYYLLAYLSTYLQKKILGGLGR